MHNIFRAVLGSILLACTLAAHAEEPIHWDVINLIRDEGFHRSEVLDTVTYIADSIGPRVTNSPQQREASEWTRQKLEDWGLENATLEEWGEFGRGWSFTRCDVQLVEPISIPLFALPKAWTPGTDGPVTGEVIIAKIKSKKDFKKFEGKLKGKIALVSDYRDAVKGESEEVFTRYTEEDLCGLEEFPIPRDRSSDGMSAYRKRVTFRDELREFWIKEGVLALIELSSRDSGIIRVTGNRAYEAGEDPGPLQLSMITEHYNRLARFVNDDKKVEIQIDVEAAFHEDDPKAYNTIAEIPGTSKKREVVMLGGHLDSWHTGTGATDNASGVSIAMEAVRILKAIGVKPKRTIRIALWTGEEQGLLGSRAYVKNHFATRPESTDEDELALPAYLRKSTWPIQTKSAHEKLSAYFNLDNGSGRIRGIYTQENIAVKPIFEAWLEAFHDIGADTVSNRNTGSTDHVPFDRVGLPGFQFIQDQLEYSPRTHHSHLDVVDRVRKDDLIQASVVMASFVYHAAMRDDLLPRKPMPQAPKEKKKKKKDEDNDDDNEKE
jgi:hypothetical protein